jgi:hypothetical protein
MNHLESSFSGKNALWRYLIMLIVLFTATNTIGGIPLLIALGLKSAADPGIIEQLAENPNDLTVLGLDPNLYLLTMLFPFLIGFVTFVLLIRPLNHRGLLTIINGTDKFRWNRFFISALVWIIISAIYLFAFLKIDPTNFVLNNRSITIVPLILISVFLIPFQAAFEELIQGLPYAGIYGSIEEQVVPAHNDISDVCAYACFEP